MALTATMHHFQITLSDVDRGVYESLDLRVARHPSETMRYLVTRTLAYCLSYEEGIAFSKGGLSSAEEAPISVRDRTGVLRAWIDVGAPSAEAVCASWACCCASNIAWKLTSASRIGGKPARVQTSETMARRYG